MNCDFGLVLAPWFLADPGDELLERAVGEIGPDRLVLPVVTGSVDDVRLDGPLAGRRFVSEGGWHYAPGPVATYANTRIRPRAARWCATRDALARVLDRCVSLNVRMMFRVAVSHSPAATEHFPAARMKTAWGDERGSTRTQAGDAGAARTIGSERGAIAVPGNERESAGACVSNPDVRELLTATLDDLSRFDPAGFEIVDWRLDPFDGRPELAWNNDISRLLGLCFCESCRQAAAAAGCDPDAAARSTQVELRRRLDEPERRFEPAAGEPAIRSYIAARQSDLNRWLDRLAKRFDRYVRVHVGEPDADAGPPPRSDAWLPVLRCSTNAVRTELARPADARGERAREEAAGRALRVWRPDFVDSGELARFVNDAHAGGAWYFDFEGLHQAPAEAVTWLRQAARLARRSQM